ILEYQRYFAESTIFFASIIDKPYFSLNDLTVFTSVESFNISFASFFISSYSPVFSNSLEFSLFQALFLRIKLTHQATSNSTIIMYLISAQVTYNTPCNLILSDA